MNAREKKRLQEEFDSLIDMIQGSCISYAYSYDKAVSECEDELSFIEKNYAPNAPLRKTKIEESEQKKADTIAKAKEDADCLIASYIEGIKRTLTLDIQKTLDVEGLKELQMIADSSAVSPREFEILSDKYSGRGYWIERALSRIASENGVDYDATPGIDERVRILDALFSQHQKYINGYNGINTYPDIVAGVSDAVLERSKVMFFGHKYGASLDAYASGVVTGLRKHLDSPTDCRQILKNALDGEDSTDGRRDAVIAALAFKNHKAIPDYVLDSLGLSSEIKDFQKTENHHRYLDAQKALSVLNDNESSDSLVDRLSGLREKAKENKYLADMLDDMCKRSPALFYAQHSLDAAENGKDA